MNDKLYLIKLGEISLKGGNRHTFEKLLRENIREKLSEYNPKFEYQKGRIFLYVDQDTPDEVVTKALSTTFGLSGWAKAYECEKDEGKL